MFFTLCNGIEIIMGLFYIYKQEKGENYFELEIITGGKSQGHMAKFRMYLLDKIRQ